MESTPALPSYFQVAMHLNRNPGLTVVLGNAQTGKSTLLAKLAPQLQGCVVLVSTCTPSLNFEPHTQLRGRFKPCRECAERDELLDRVLATRAAGLLRLELPVSVDHFDKPAPSTLVSMLTQAILRTVQEDAAQTVDNRVVLIIDAGENLLEDAALARLLRLGRMANVHLVLAQRSTRRLDEFFLVNTRHFLVFNSSEDASLLRQHLNDSQVDPTLLEQGQFWHKAVVEDSTALLHVLS